MKKINILLTLLSLNAVLIIIERLSPTTKIILQPYNFLRLHELFQMTLVIPLSIVISYFILKYISADFQNIKKGRGLLLGVIFILGLYFTATGNGLHEVASFIFNTFCPTSASIIDQPPACVATFFNDYYFGNIVYFIGLFLSNMALIILERKNPSKDFKTKDLAVTAVNGAIFGLTLFAYGAFDLVLVGLYFCVISAVSTLFLLSTAKSGFRNLPFTFYSAIAYTSSAIGILLYRMR